MRELQVSAEGKAQQFLMDSTGNTVSSVASVWQQNSRLFMGNLDGDYVSYYDLPTTGQ